MRSSRRQFEGTDLFIEMTGLAVERGDDVTGGADSRGGLQPCDNPALAPPGTGSVGEVDEGPHPFLAELGAARPIVVGASIQRSRRRGRR